MTSIFVAKLDFGVTSEELRAAFAEYGKVLKASVAMDRETGKSRGFGFVEMEDAAEARNAISALDNSNFNGRPVSVKQAEPRESRPARDAGSRPPFQGGGERKPFQRDDSKGFTPRPAASPSLTPDDFTKLASQSSPKNNKTEKKKKNGLMEAYKKSGKTPRYDLDDDMDDWKPNSGKKSNSQFDEEEDEDKF